MINKLKRKLKRVKPFPRYLFYVITLLYLGSFIYFAKSILSLYKIETFIRYTALIIFIAYFFFYILFSLMKMFQKKYTGYYLTSLISIIFILLFCGSSFVLDYAFTHLARFTEKDTITYTSYGITLADTTLSAKSKIGMISSEDDIEGSILPKRIIKDHKLEYEVKLYDDYTALLYALYQNEVDLIFITSNYVTLFSGEKDFANIATDTKIVYKDSDEFANNDALLTSDKALTEPFTVLVLGVDSEYDGLNANAAFNGDTLILATFNPKTLNATLLSLPRDTFVPIACRNGVEAKINSSAAYGTSCVIDTIEDLTGIDIDYYVKINFKGVVELVDALGGIEVDVEEPDFAYNHGIYCKGMICEQNSDRAWGDRTVYIAPGHQVLDGEQALAYSRCRTLFAESDLARNRHQQEIILASAKKAMTLRTKDDFEAILNAISNNLSTNMSTSQILSSYNIFKNILSNMQNGGEIINIQKSHLEVYDLPVYLPNLGMTTAALGYYKDSLDAIVKNMKINLELEKPEYIKTFNYSINDTYTERVIGTGLKADASNKIIANMIGKTKEETEKYCSNNGYSCSFKYVDENSDYYDEDIDVDLITGQNPHQGSIASGVKNITFYIKGASSD